MTEHKEERTRTAENKDIPHLKALWKTVFGDDDTDIDYFFSIYFEPELTVVIDDVDSADESGKPSAAAYILPIGDLVLPDHTRLNCAMLYAIATLPEYRGRGYGEAVTRAAAALAIKKGFPAVVLKPADHGLFAFYEKHTDFREFFVACITCFTEDELPPPEPRYAMAPVSASEYRRLRQGFLRVGTFIDMDERGLKYQQYLSTKAGGGGLYALLSGRANAGSENEIDSYSGCATIEREGDTVRIKELLLAGSCGIAQAVTAVAQLYPAKTYEVRSPTREEENKNSAIFQFGMMALVHGCPNIPYVYSAKWYGLAFD